MCSRGQLQALCAVEDSFKCWLVWAKDCFSSLLGMQKTCWLRMRTMCWSGGTYLPMDWNYKNQLSMLVKHREDIIISSKCNSPQYSRKIANLCTSHILKTNNKSTTKKLKMSSMDPIRKPRLLMKVKQLLFLIRRLLCYS